MEEVYAVYEKGVLKPRKKLELPEGALVRVKVGVVRATHLYEIVRRYSILLKDVEEDPLTVLLRMRGR